MTYNIHTVEYTKPVFGIENEFNARGFLSRHRASRGDAIDLTKAALRNVGIDWIDVIRDGTGAVDVELVFPPAVDCPEFWNDYSTAMQACKDLGLRYVKNCGLHVHVGTRRTIPAINSAEFWEASKARARGGIFKPDSRFLMGDDNVMSFPLIKDIVRFYALNQSFIDNAMPASRANQPANSMISSMAWVNGNAEFEQTSTLEELSHLIYRHNRQNSAGWTACSEEGGVKFNAVNVGSFQRGTIEFRQHPATMSSQKARDWMLLLTNAIEICDRERLTDSANINQPPVVTTETETITTPDCPYNQNSNIGQLYIMARQQGGATVREMMHQTGMEAQNIRSRFSEIRRRIGQDAVLTYTQQHYNHSYGSSNGQYDLGGYEVLTEYSRQISAAPVAASPGSVFVRDDAPTSITHNLSYQTARNFMQGSVTRLRH